jgi:pyridoxine kinase
MITDTKIVDRASLQKVLTTLHEKYSVPNVVISSIPMTEWLWDPALTNVYSAFCDQEATLLCLASVRAAPGTVSGPPSAVYAACVQLVPGYFSGVGDLFSALVLGHYSPSPSSSPNSLPPLAHAVSLALTKTQAILRLTERHATSLPPGEHTLTDNELDEVDPERRVRRMRARELRLVQGRKILSGEAMGELKEMRKWEDFWRSNDKIYIN